MIHCLNSRQKMIAVAWLIGLFSAPLFALSFLGSIASASDFTIPDAVYRWTMLGFWGIGLIMTILKRDDWEWVDKTLTAFAATVSSRARGKVELWMAENEVIDAWAVYRGRKRTKKTMVSLIDFLQFQYGFDLRSAPRINGELTAQQSRQVTRFVANLLIDAGVFTFDGGTPEARAYTPEDAAAREVRLLREQQASDARRAQRQQDEANRAARKADFDRELKIKRLKENYASAVSDVSRLSTQVANGDKGSIYYLNRAKQEKAKIEAELMAM